MCIEINRFRGVRLINRYEVGRKFRFSVIHVKAGFIPYLIQLVYTTAADGVNHEEDNSHHCIVIAYIGNDSV